MRTNYSDQPIDQLLQLAQAEVMRLAVDQAGFPDRELFEAVVERLSDMCVAEWGPPRGDDT